MTPLSHLCTHTTKAPDSRKNRLGKAALEVHKVWMPPLQAPDLWEGSHWTSTGWTWEEQSFPCKWIPMDPLRNLWSLSFRVPNPRGAPEVALVHMLKILGSTNWEIDWVNFLGDRSLLHFWKKNGLFAFRAATLRRKVCRDGKLNSSWEQIIIWHNASFQSLF